MDVRLNLPSLNVRFWLRFQPVGEILNNSGFEGQLTTVN
jgi:hypothetical protein